MPGIKTKTMQKKDFKGVSERDCFQTPRYATQLLIPYIPKYVRRIWECAVGDGRLARVLLDNGYAVEGTDLQRGVNFLEQKDTFSTDIEVTNPPFSLKEEFLNKCLELGNPFALLMPFEMNGWMFDAFDKWGCQAIIPRRRINYITPNTLNRIHEGEVFRRYSNTEAYKKVKGNLIKFKKEHPITWGVMLSNNPNYCRYETVDSAPQELLYRYSSSDFHSAWLTRGFNLSQQLTFVDLPIEKMRNNI